MEQFMAVQKALRRAVLQSWGIEGTHTERRLQDRRPGMVFRLSLKLSLFAVLVSPTIPLFSQVAPAATAREGMPIAAGIGASNFSIDWGPGRRMEGITAWVEWTG